MFSYNINSLFTRYNYTIIKVVELIIFINILDDLNLNFTKYNNINNYNLCTLYVLLDILSYHFKGIIN